LSEGATFYQRSDPEGPLRQGEFISDLTRFVLIAETMATDRPDFHRNPQPLSVILSQDCDLEREFDARNNPAGTAIVAAQIASVILCEVHLVGQYHPKGGLTKQVKGNSDERYQYLRNVLPEQDVGGVGYEDMIIDFRRHFSVTVDQAYMNLGLGAKRRFRLLSPYMEHLCNRFAKYLSRIALPEEHLPPS
jgi:hypothetical protein